MRDRGLRYWLPAYLAQSLRRAHLRRVRKTGLTHILFLVCDHFEPRHGVVTERQGADRLAAWKVGYRQLQERCFDRYGLRPVHTWFYPPHHSNEYLPALAEMAFDGLGEVELHYHHEGDTADTLRKDLRRTLESYRRAGLLMQLGRPPESRFGFIHGDWALDNSAHGRFCGVNGELSILREAGCWGDLTMPSTNGCQTRKINSIYYASDSPLRSKSHDRGSDARVGRDDQTGLMLIQGPLGIYFQRGPRIENASLRSGYWGTETRIRSWLDCHVHVRGRPDWLFVKLHTHGAIEGDFDALFGDRAWRMHRTLAERYNDGKRFKLHYITARQAYNLVRAAEQGRSGDPREHVDFEVPRQVTSLYCLDAPHELQACTPDRLVINEIAESDDCTLRLRYPGIEEISGPLRSVEVAPCGAVLRVRPRPGGAKVRVRLAAAAVVRRIAGGTPGIEGDALWLSGNVESRIDLAHDGAAGLAG
jgi:hypothetical protein